MGYVGEREIERERNREQREKGRIKVIEQAWGSEQETWYGCGRRDRAKKIEEREVGKSNRADRQTLQALEAQQAEWGYRELVGNSIRGKQPHLTAVAKNLKSRAILSECQKIGQG